MWLLLCLLSTVVAENPVLGLQGDQGGAFSLLTLDPATGAVRGKESFQTSFVLPFTLVSGLTVQTPFQSAVIVDGFDKQGSYVGVCEGVAFENNPSVQPAYGGCFNKTVSFVGIFQDHATLETFVIGSVNVDGFRQGHIWSSSNSAPWMNLGNVIPLGPDFGGPLSYSSKYSTLFFGDGFGSDIYLANLVSRTLRKIAPSFSFSGFVYSDVHDLFLMWAEHDNGNTGRADLVSVDIGTGAVLKNYTSIDLRVSSNFVAAFVYAGVDEPTSTFFSYFKFSTSPEKRWFSYNLLTGASQLSNVTFLLTTVANK